MTVKNPLDATDYQRAHRRVKGSMTLLIAHIAELEAVCNKMRDQCNPETQWQRRDTWQLRANGAASMLRQAKNLKAQLWKED